LTVFFIIYHEYLNQGDADFNNYPILIHNITNMDHEDMLDVILEWAKRNSKFDASTMEGIQENYEIYGSFTSCQEYAIENVYYKWKIDQWYYGRHIK